MVRSIRVILSGDSRIVSGCHFNIDGRAPGLSPAPRDCGGRLGLASPALPRRRLLC